MRPLARKIVAEIERSGPISVARYMELALADPDHGYYATRDPLGAGGDFVTAPEVSQMFGELIGLWAAVVWEAMGRPRPMVLAELGPGRGTLMADALRAAAVQEGFLAAVEVHLVETGTRLKAMQADRLAGFHPTFHAAPEDLPQSPIVVIANEFFDALPVRQLVRVAEGWAERLVDVGTDGGAPFRFRPGAPPAPDPPPDLPAGAEQGAVFEFCPAARHVVAGLARRLAARPGAALVIDYGHGTTAPGETLQAVRAHRYADPLTVPGEADLTAHVDFAALARAAAGAGARVFGPVSQGPFLQALGITERAGRLSAGATAAEARAVEAGLRRLIAPSEMGNLFKAMGLASPGTPALPGFPP